MQLGQTYNAQDLPQGDNDGNFKAIPDGKYQVTIVKAELTPTKSGTGEYIKVRMDITGPSYQGRVLFANLNIRNQSEVAERIGLQQFGDVIRAIGKSSVSDTDELIGGNLTVKVAKIKDEQYGDEDGFKNEVKAFMASNGSAAPAPQAQQQSAPQPQPTGATPPWVKP